MAHYKVINQQVEINGKTRFIDDVLETSEFIAELPNDDLEAPKVSEVESLLESGHIVEVTE